MEEKIAKDESLPFDITAEYEKTKFRTREAVSCLVGDYDEHGAYQIPQTIREEIVNAEKVIIDNNSAVFDVYITTEEYTLSLQLKIQEDGQAKIATLNLIEKIQSLSDELASREVTFIASYQDTNDADFFEKVLKAFHLHISDDEGAKDIFSYCPIIDARRKGRRLALASMIEDGDEYNKKYVLEMLKLLEKDPYGKNIILKYKKTMSENVSRLNKGEADYYFKLKVLLDQIIDDQGYKPLQESEIERIQGEILKSPKKPKPEKVEEEEQTSSKVEEPPKKPKEKIIIKDKPGKSKDNGGGENEKPGFKFEPTIFRPNFNKKPPVADNGNYRPQIRQPAQEPAQEPAQQPTEEQTLIFTRVASLEKLETAKPTAQNEMGMS